MDMLRKLLMVSSLFVLTFAFGHLQATTIDAQNPTQVECGTEIESVFSSDTQVHTYQIAVEAGTALVLYAEATGGSYQNLLLETELTTPGGNVIVGWYLGGSSYYSQAQARGILSRRTVRTDPLPQTGNYTIRLIGYTDTGSPYRFYTSCIQLDGTVVSVSNKVSGIQCGSIIENKFVWDPEIHRYYLMLQAGDSVSLFAESAVVSYQNLLLEIELTTPRGNIITGWYLGGSSYYSQAQARGILSTKTVETDPLPETGIYRIEIIGYTDTGANYVFQVGCVLRDGTIINPGDAPPVNLVTPTEEAVSTPATVAFSGFGFPGVAPKDFSAGIEIPLQAGQTQTAPLGGDVVLYTYEASADETRTLHLTRLSGNISAGIAVIKRDTNEIIFFGGMPSSNNLSVALIFPASGTYAIGLFRVDTVERSGTSGAIQIILE